MLCFLRRLRNKDDKYNSIIAALLSSPAVAIEQNPVVRKLICYYFFANSIDSFLSTLESNKIAPKPKDWGLILYCFMITFFVINYALNPDVIGQKIVKMFTKITFLKPNEIVIIQEIFYKRDLLLNGNTVTLFGK